MRCNPSRWLWGLIPIAMLAWGTFYREQPQVEADLTERATAALRDAGQPWAAVTLVGRDAVITGRASKDGEPKAALDAVRSVWGIRTVQLKTDLAGAAQLPASIGPHSVAPGSDDALSAQQDAEATAAQKAKQEADMEAEAKADAEAQRAKEEAAAAEKAREAEQAAALKAQQEAEAAAAQKAKQEAEAAAAAEQKAKDEAAAAETARAEEQAAALKAQQEAEVAAAQKAKEEAEAAAAAEQKATEEAAAAEKAREAEQAAALKAQQEAEAAAAQKAKEEVEAAAAAEQKAKDEAAAAEKARAEEQAAALKAQQEVEAAAAQKAKEEAESAAAEQKAKDEAAAAGQARAEEQAAALKAQQEAEVAAAQKAKRKTTPETSACEKRLTEAAEKGVIHFDRASADIDPKSSLTIAKLAEIIKRCPGARVEVEGHTDAEGEPDRNQRLSERRSRAVVRSLVHAGVAEDRLTSVGHGAGSPAAPNDTPAGMAKNRRIEFKVFTD